MSNQGIDLKNRELLCYQNLHKITYDFLNVLSTASYDVIDLFKKQREGLIHVLLQIQTELKTVVIDPIQTQNIEVQKKGLLKAIIEMDTQILSQLATLKADTVTKLQSVQEGRKTISAYRSPMEQIAEQARVNQKA